MIVNTRTHKLTLTETERGQLRKAIDLLNAVEKHADSTTSDFAAIAADNIDKTLESLAVEETAAA